MTRIPCYMNNNSDGVGVKYAVVVIELESVAGTYKIIMNA